MIVHTSTEWELFFLLYRSRNSRKVLISFLLFSSFFSIAVTTTYAILNGFFEEQPISFLRLVRFVSPPNYTIMCFV